MPGILPNRGVAAELDSVALVGGILKRPESSHPGGGDAEIGYGNAIVEGRILYSAQLRERPHTRSVGVGGVAQAFGVADTIDKDDDNVLGLVGGGGGG